MQRANDALKTSEDFSLETGDSTPCFCIHKTLMFNNKTFSAPKVYSMSKWALLLKVFIVLVAASPMKMLQADDVLKTSEEYSLETFEGKLPSKELPVIVVPDGTPSLSTSFTFFFIKVTKFSLCIFQHKKTAKTVKVLKWRTQTALCSIEVYTLWGFTKFTKLSRLSCFIQSRVAV